MTDLSLQLGVGGIFALMIIREVMPFIKRNGGWKNKYEEAKHNELVLLIKSVNDHISAQTGILKDLCREIRKLKD